MSWRELAWIGVFLGCATLWAASNILPRDVWLTVVSIAAGVVLGGFLNWWFSRTTSHEVRLILRGLAEMAAGRKVGFRTNAKGKFVGLDLHRSISDAVSTSGVDIHLVVIRREDEDAPPEQESRN
jgi:hypothetical protein